MSEVGILWTIIVGLLFICAKLYHNSQDNKEVLKHMNLANKEPLTQEMYTTFIEYTNGYKKLCKFHAELYTFYVKEYLSLKNEKEKLLDTGFQLTEEHFLIWVKGKFYDGSKTFSRDWSQETFLPYNKSNILKIQADFGSKIYGKSK